MKSFLSICLPASALAMLIASSAEASTVYTFTSSIDAVPNVIPNDGCGVGLLHGILDTAATSSLGSYDYSHSVCITGGPGPVSGTFELVFGDGSVTGLISGIATAGGTPGVLDQTFDYTVTGGTGNFAGSLGSFVGTGTVDTRMPPPLVAFDFTGDIIAGAVPEPSTWASLVLGFCLVGLALRRKSRRPLAPTAQGREIEIRHGAAPDSRLQGGRIKTFAR